LRSKRPTWPESAGMPKRWAQPQSNPNLKNHFPKLGRRNHE
jgi:hypothetical protein